MENAVQNKQENQIKICRFCGKQIFEKDAKICSSCGNPTDVNITNNVNMKNKGITLLLLLFFGGLGVHKFYEGKILLGVVYLIATPISAFLLFTGFIGGIITFDPSVLLAGVILSGILGISLIIDFIKVCCKPAYYL